MEGFTLGLASGSFVVGAYGRGPLNGRCGRELLRLVVVGMLDAEPIAVGPYMSCREYANSMNTE